jgi:hypothetical protein
MRSGNTRSIFCLHTRGLMETPRCLSRRNARPSVGVSRHRDPANHDAPRHRRDRSGPVVGHDSFTAKGYDCSGSVSYALHGAGLLSYSMVSGQLARHGTPGPCPCPAAPAYATPSTRTPNMSSWSSPASASTPATTPNTQAAPAGRWSPPKRPHPAEVRGAASGRAVVHHGTRNQLSCLSGVDSMFRGLIIGNDQKLTAGAPRNSASLSTLPSKFCFYFTVGEPPQSGPQFLLDGVTTNPL